jgi:Dynamin family
MDTLEHLQSPILSNKDTIPLLRTEKSSRRLEQIVALGARGVADRVSLPQLVVFGDQSASKSSVLEGLTGLPFPRQDGVCTGFATEIILTHAKDAQHVEASIIPAESRSEELQSRLKDFHRTLVDFSELPAVIAESGEAMGGYVARYLPTALNLAISQQCSSAPALTDG